MYVDINMNRFVRFTIILLIVFSMLLTAGCSKKPVNNSNNQTTNQNQEGASTKVVEYFDVDTEEESNQEDDSSYSNDPQVEEPVQQKSFAKSARIKTWYSTGGFSSETAWVHFKAVDAQGKTVKEVLGSDKMNMRKEKSALAETSKRRELVEQPREDMVSAGWTEVGVAEGGEWYEYIFGQ